MNHKADSVGTEGLLFFGKISASISHEIKNVLAIINENAGLLGDCILMAEKGIPLDPERLAKISQMIGKQIIRADGIVKNMNEFAHSVDNSSKTFNLDDLITLLIKLSSRIATMQGVTLEKSPASDDSVSLTANPFLLKNLLWRSLAYAMTVTGPGKTFQLAAAQQDTVPAVRISGVQGLQQTGEEGFPGELEQEMLKSLHATISLLPQHEELVISFAEC